MIGGFYVTAKGQEYIARSTTDRALKFTKGQFGDGEMPDGTDPTTMTTLVNPLGTLNISKIMVDKNSTTITTQFSNKVNGSILPEFYMTEIGIYGKLQTYDGSDDPEKPETLLYYGYIEQSKADHIPATLTEYIINFPLKITNASTVNVTVDSSMVYPTLDEYNSTVSHKIAAEGTGGALTATSELSLVDELQITVKLPADLEEGATLSMNDGTAYPINGLDGNPVKAGPESGSYINLIFSESAGCWYMLGGGNSLELAADQEAIAGTDKTKAMTPYTTKKAIDNAVGNIGSILDSINGEVI